MVRPSEAVININLKDQTEALLKTLTPREEKVIKMRFGLGDGSEHTLEEVGQNFAVTRERIRQIEAKALRKLRHPSRSRKLKAFSWKARVSNQPAFQPCTCTCPGRERTGQRPQRRTRCGRFSFASALASGEARVGAALTLAGGRSAIARTGLARHRARAGTEK